MNDIYCVLTGHTPPENLMDDDSEMDEIPVGWIKIEVTKKTENPDYQNILTVMNSEVEAALAQIKGAKPELEMSDDDLSELRSVLEIQSKAKFAAIMSITSKYIYQEEDAYFSNTDIQEALESKKEVFKLLDIKLD